MKFLFLVVVINCGSALALSQQQQPVTHRLDLLALRPADQAAFAPSSDQPQDRRAWLRPAPPVDSGPAPTFPFEISLISTDRTAYSAGDMIVFEMRLKNVSGQSVAFPWTIEPGIKSTMRRARRLVISLFFIDPVMGRQQFGFQTVYGAEPVVGSLRFIEPGESLEIRAAAPVDLHKGWSETSGNTWSREVNVKANLQLASRDTYYPPGVSRNALSVQLSAK